MSICKDMAVELHTLHSMGKHSLTKEFNWVHFKALKPTIQFNLHTIRNKILHEDIILC